jgi:capsular polysaccharide biosynthesis protein
MNPEANAPRPEHAPEPDRGWSRGIVALRDATVVPPDTSSLRRRAGIVDSTSVYRPEGAIWRFRKPLTRAPRLPGADHTLTGTWLWAGMLFDHFGHFLVEGVSRLWGLSSDEGRAVDGVLFVPTRPRRQGGLLDFQRATLEAFDVTVPVRVVDAPTRVERLVVPGQGLGLGDMIVGTPEMRAHARVHFGRTVVPRGPSRLFVARTAIASNGGALIGETVLARHLARQGYEVFEPERHDVAIQIARYKAARQIVVTDGSAAHLLAFVARPDQDIAYLVRRGFWGDGPVGHIASFSGRAPLVPETMIAEWRPAPTAKDRGVAFALHDLRALHAAFVAHGFIDRGSEWPALSEEFVRRYLEDTGRVKDLTRVPVVS